MYWWKIAPFDTCSLITLDKAILEQPDLARALPQQHLGIGGELCRGSVASGNVSENAVPGDFLPIADTC